MLIIANKTLPVREKSRQKTLSHITKGSSSLVGLFCMIVAAGVFNSPAEADSDSPVGYATLVLGKSIKISNDSEDSQLERGAPINEGDRIETYSNGHVHIRFEDGALVSVRPNSLLHIERYEFNEENPSESLVKFELRDGVTRAISGEAARSARDRFRLNTPIAAIGVRGTDFVVSVDGSITKALVNEGAIVMAPFSEGCRMEGIGPCVANSLELTGDSFKLAALEQNSSSPRLLPLQSIATPGVIQGEIQRIVTDSGSQGIFGSQNEQSPAGPVSAQSEQSAGNEVMLDGVTAVKVQSNAKIALDAVSATDFIPEAPIAVTPDGKIDGFDFTPPKLLTASQLSDRQLVWGRYFSSPISTDRLTLSFKEASESRSTAVGTAQYGLFRSGTHDQQISTADSGIIGFQLTSAQAVFNSNTGIVAMSVDGGSLEIDFQENSFATGLSLNSELTGQVDFFATGRLFDGGFLRALGETQSLRGAISFDGTEAGYHFEKEVNAGIVSGLTLWDSK